MKKQRDIKRNILMITVAVLVMFSLSQYNTNFGTVYADSATTDIVIQEEIVEDTQETEDVDVEPEETEDLSSKETEDETEEVEEPEKVEEPEVVEENNGNPTEHQGDVEEKVQTKEETSELRGMPIANGYLVTSFTELKTMIESNGTSKKYEVYYLGADIVATSGINIPRDYYFTLNGTHPETNVRYSYTEKASTSIGDTIAYNHAQYRGGTVRFKDIDIYGNNANGFISSLNAKIYIGFSNVNYSGPRLANSPNSNLTLSGGNVIDIVSNSANVPRPAMVIEDLTLEGTNEVTSTSTEPIFEITSTIVSYPNSHLTVYANSPLFDYEALLITIMENAVIEYNGQSTRTNSTPEFIINTGSLENYGKIIINAQDVLKDVVSIGSGYYGEGEFHINARDVGQHALYLKGQSRDIIVENGRFSIKVNSNTGPLIEAGMINFDDSKVYIETGSHQGGTLVKSDSEISFGYSDVDIIVGNSSPQRGEYVIQAPYAIMLVASTVSINTGSTNYDAAIDTGYLQVMFDPTVAGYLTVVNHSENPVFVNTPNARIDTQQINLYDDFYPLDQYPGERGGANQRIAYRNNREFRLQFSSTLTSTSVKTNIQTDEDNTNVFTAQGKTITAMGNMIFEVQDNVENSKKLKLKTNPNSWVQLDSNPPFETYADSNGIVDADLPKHVSNGSHDISSFGNYLFRTTKIVYDVDGDLEIESIPSSFNFGEVKLETKPTVYNRLEDSQIIIRDGRKNKTGWKLSVYVQKPLQITGIPSSELPTALVLGNENNPVTNTPLTVYETSTTNYEDETVINWKQDEGLLLFIESYTNIMVNQKYEAKLMWVLESK